MIQKKLMVDNENKQVLLEYQKAEVKKKQEIYFNKILCVYRV